MLFGRFFSNVLFYIFVVLYKPDFPSIVLTGLGIKTAVNLCIYFSANQMRGHWLKLFLDKSQISQKQKNAWTLNHQTHKRPFAMVNITTDHQTASIQRSQL